MFKRHHTLRKFSSFASRHVVYSREGFQTQHIKWLCGENISVRWKRVTVALNLKACKVDQSHVGVCDPHMWRNSMERIYTNVLVYHNARGY